MRRSLYVPSSNPFHPPPHPLISPTIKPLRPSLLYTNSLPHTTDSGLIPKGRRRRHRRLHPARTTRQSHRRLLARPSAWARDRTGDGCVDRGAEYLEMGRESFIPLSLV